MFSCIIHYCILYILEDISNICTIMIVLCTNHYLYILVKLIFLFILKYLCKSSLVVISCFIFLSSYNSCLSQGHTLECLNLGGAGLVWLISRTDAGRGKLVGAGLDWTRVGRGHLQLEMLITTSHYLNISCS